MIVILVSEVFQKRFCLTIIRPIEMIYALQFIFSLDLHSFVKRVSKSVHADLSFTLFLVWITQ